jgi:chromosome segregation ATPase
MEVIEMSKIITLLALLIFVSSAYGATIYKWVNTAGVVNYTDDYSLVPPAYHDRLETQEMAETPTTIVEEVPALHKTAPQQQAVKTDIYGLGEEYWQERAQPWRERLSEAQAKCDDAQEKYMAKSEELSRRRYGSPTQYKMNIMQLSELGDKRKKCEAEIAEANEMLEKVYKEAEEAKADPAWLR